ncbi:MAG: DUF1553 domain-containing protein [Planctomycetota bacterium]|nr:DUF1553 domain-containing protein [Planctomycetota bacterium]
MGLLLAAFAWLSTTAFAEPDGGAPTAALLSADVSPVEAIDFYVEKKLRDLQITQAGPSSPHALLRRITLDLAGRVPTTSEIDRYLGTQESLRLQALISETMISPWYVRHTARELNALLKGMGSNGPELMDYLVHAVEDNRRWDTMFRELVGVSPAAFKPERFVLGRLKDRDLLTRDVSSIYFGLNISCAQCHTHPYVDTMTQAYFFGMKSFFSRSYDFEGHLLERTYSSKLEYEPVGEAVRRAELMFLSGEVVQSDAPDVPDLKQAIAREDREIEALRKGFKEARKKDSLSQPAIPSDADTNLRRRFADVALSTKNQPRFASSMVNRMWHRFMGYGLVMRIDQMHEGNPASHPELLTWLTRDFIEHGFDLERLTRAIVGSRAYARSSIWEMPTPPPAEAFAVAPVRPLTPMQMGLSMLFVGNDLQAAHRPPEPLEGRIVAMETAALALFADVFEDPYEGIQFNAAEALAMSNDAKRLAEMGHTLVDGLSDISDPARQVEQAVLSVLGRPAVSEEKVWFEEYLSNRNDRRAALTQIVWALFTSSEFRFNH